MHNLLTPLESLLKFNPFKIKRLRELLGERVFDALSHLPVGVESRIPLKALQDYRSQMDRVTLTVTIAEHHSERRSLYKIDAHDADGQLLQLVYFHGNRGFLRKLYPEGATRVVSGHLERTAYGFQMVHPDFAGEIKDLQAWCGSFPIYPLTSGVVQKDLRSLAKRFLPLAQMTPEWIVPQLLLEKKWPAFGKALEQLHSPIKESDLSPQTPARQRLAFDELLAFQIGLRQMRLQEVQEAHAPLLSPMPDQEDLFLKTLPFQLTLDQQYVCTEIGKDMQQHRPMRRLLQGDVGSGKTVVAFWALVRAVANEKQGAFLAPTEILARQQYALFARWGQTLGITVACLTGKTTAKERRALFQKLEAGEINLLVGTHALLEETVVFRDLSVVVIDEQHRFGVAQRARLIEKAQAVHVLFMTATPIPRTLVLAYYGDIQVSTIAEKPHGRLPIQTNVLPLTRMPEVLERLKKYLETAQRVYWICPLIDESDENPLMAAVERFEALEKLFPGNVALLHGRMTSLEKENVMAEFRNGTRQILVSTTVVEVGMDVPEANLMIIEHAERFGLSQLHQLRGRVGRSHEQGICLLLYRAPLSDVSRQRLEILRTTDNGFKIAEEDLKLRGSGEMLGTKQSGFAAFRFADLQWHTDLLELALEHSKHYRSDDPAYQLLLGLFEYDEGKKRVGSG